MEHRNVTQQKIDVTEYKRRYACEDDCPELVAADCAVFVDGVVKLVYVHHIERPEIQSLRNHLRKVRYEKSTRTRGTITRSRIFGYAPRNGVRNLGCRATSIATEQPEQHAALINAAGVASELYATYFPDVYQKHETLAGKVPSHWRLPKSVFTSGIANFNNPLQYHFDTGNFAAVCSAMFGFRAGIQGGHLCCPELGLRFAIGDCSLLLFDGQRLLHGVTPIVKTRESGFRYTVVYYSLKQMWSCESPANEIERLRSLRTTIEARRSKTEGQNQ